MNYMKYILKMRERQSAIVKLFTKGHTTSQIGAKYKISRQRVQQILKKSGIGRHDGGCYLRKVKRTATQRKQTEKKLRDREKRCQNVNGCSLAEYRLVQEKFKRNYYSSPAYYFRNHKHAARNRGIVFKLTLPEWWDIWEKSGKWPERGRAANEYAMARFGDIGPYSINNVRIITARENIDEYYSRPATKKLHRQLTANGKKKRFYQILSKYGVKLAGG